MELYKTIKIENIIIFLKDLLIVEPKIIYDDFDFVARYFPDEDIIKINNKNNDLNKYDQVYIIAHEFRHAYQFKQLTDKDNEDESLINIWEQEFDNYINLGNKGYEKQLVEIDAHAFARWILKVLFLMNSYYPDGFDKSLIDIRESQIAECFQKEEVVNCMNYAGIKNHLNMYS